MRRIIISSWLVLLIQFLANASAPAVFAQPSDGQILNSKPWPPLPNYGALCLSLFMSKIYIIFRTETTLRASSAAR